jgi:hypothetical protein
MYMHTATLGYIDPNTSQHVFSLLGPALAFLTATGGLALTAIVFVRHKIASYFRRASWTRRVAILCVVVGTLAITAAVIWWIVW